jgi:hypothetical protein
MPKMRLERAGREREREEVGVHDGLDTSKVSPAPSSQLVYLLSCLAVSKRK